MSMATAAGPGSNTNTRPSVHAHGTERGSGGRESPGASDRRRRRSMRACDKCSTSRTRCNGEQPWINFLDNIVPITTLQFGAKPTKVWPVMFPSHQTHLIQPLDVGCFRSWKHYQQTAVWDAIRSYEPEYNVQSFFRDLPQIRAKTFTKRTIKHAFKNAAILPISFTMVQRKLKEYGRKERQKPKGINILEFGTDSEKADSDIGSIDSTTTLPPVRKTPTPPPTSYNECYTALKTLELKVQGALSSPSRRQYTTITKRTGILLMRRSLREMEIENRRLGAITVHKERLNNRKSLSKGGQIYAFQGLHQIGVKRRKEADDTLKRAKKALQIVENKLRAEFEQRGIQGRKDEIIRKKQVQLLLSANQYIPESLHEPIRDRRKEPTTNELESLRANQSFYDAIVQAEHAKDLAYSENPEKELIHPEILEFERRFAIQRGGIQQVDIGSSSDIGGGIQSNIEGSRACSVVSQDSIAANADLIRLG